MLWFAVWTVLVVGTLVGAVLLGRDLYRRARALLAELGRAADLLGQVADRAARLADEAGTPVLAPVELADPGPARERHAVTAAVRRGRAAERAERHAATRERWRSFSR